MAKSGVKTSEFWLTVLGTVATTAAAIVGALPIASAAVISATITGVYTISRTIVKASRGK